VTALNADIAAITCGDVCALYESGVDTQLRWVSAVTATTGASAALTTEPSWASNPTTAADWMACDTFKPSTVEAPNYCSFRVYSGDGGTAVHMWTLYSCVATWKLATAEAGKLPMIEWEVVCDYWADSGATATTHTTDTYSTCQPMLGATVYIDNTAVKVKNFSFDPGVSVIPYTSTEGTYGRSGWLAGAKSPKVSFIPYHDVDWITRWTAGSVVQISLEVVKDSNDFWGIFIPRAQVVDIKHEDLGNKLLSTTPTLKVLDAQTGTDTLDATPTTVKLPTYMIAVSSV
jgi:hypothetical protein